MKTYTITEGKAQLSALVAKVQASGEPVYLGKGGIPSVQIIPYKPNHGAKRLGAFQGQIKISDDFDSWDEEEASALGLLGS